MHFFLWCDSLWSPPLMYSCFTLEETLWSYNSQTLWVAFLITLISFVQTGHILPLHFWSKIVSAVI